MRVAIDVSHLNHAKLSGVGVYTVELLKALKAADLAEVTTTYRLSRFKSRRHILSHAPNSRAWLPLGVNIAADVVHGPDFRAPRTRRVPRVVTVHDLAFLREGMTSPEFAAKKKADLDQLLDLETPDAIITVSAATKNDLVRYRPHLEPRTHVVHLGGDHIRTERNAEAAAPRDPFFLFVGNLEARKNVLGVIEAFERYCATGPKNTRLVLIGKPGFGGEKILKRVSESPYKARMENPGYLTFDEMNSYYRQALALVYPSWVEGFGIPVVEAMHMGCPVITSRESSMQEIALDTAWLVDPAAPESIAQAMQRAQSLSAAEKETRTEAARRRAEQFTWARCADQTLNVYESVTGRLNT